MLSTQGRLTVYGNVDSQRLFETFIDSLADPHKPKHCASFLRGCILTVQTTSLPGALGLKNLDVLREEQQELLDAIMRFLTVERSAEETQTMAVEIETCSCQQSELVREIHRIHQVIAETPSTFVQLLDGFISIIHNVLQKVKDEDNLHKVEHNVEKAARAGKQLSWPTRPQDILPYGADISMTSLIAWVYITPRPLTLALYGTIIEICKKQVMNSVLTSTILPEYAVGIAEIPFMTWIMASTYPTPHYSAAHTLADLKRAALFFHVFSSYSDKPGFMAFLSRSQDFDIDRTINLVSMADKYLPEIYAKINPHPSDLTVASDMAYVRMVLLLFCSQVHHYFDRPPDNDKYTPMVVRTSKRLVKAEDEPVVQTYQLFVKFWQQHCCFSPGCKETFAGAERKFSKCAGCGRVPYCSKECQV